VLNVAPVELRSDEDGRLYIPQRIACPMHWLPPPHAINAELQGAPRPMPGSFHGAEPRQAHPRLADGDGPHAAAPRSLQRDERAGQELGSGSRPLTMKLTRRSAASEARCPAWRL
jgi:hypothetical protein